ncbi:MULTISPECIES: GyrI-like domain-containing protein [Methanobacterium]|nr:MULTISPECIES: GyrI-like domain-containing protein [Methanobacterium]
MIGHTKKLLRAEKMNSNQDQPKPQKIKITGEISLKLVGCVYYGDPFHSNEEWSVNNEIGVLWGRFYKLYGELGDVLQKGAVGDVAYELHLQPEDYPETGKFYVYVGIEVENLDEMPIEMFCKALPPTKYAVFTFKGEDMFSGGEYIWNEWLSRSKYDEAHPFMILAYHKNRYKGMEDPESEVDFLVPIKNKPDE